MMRFRPGKLRALRSLEGALGREARGIKNEQHRARLVRQRCAELSEYFAAKAGLS